MTQGERIAALAFALGVDVDAPELRARILDVSGCHLSALLVQPLTRGGGLASANAGGWYAVRTCTRDFNARVNFPARRGNVEFWHGVITGADFTLRAERAENAEHKKGQVKR